MRKFRKFLIAILSSILLLNCLTINVFADTSSVGVMYQAHVQNIGWQNWVSNGQTSGTTGKSLRVEALNIKLVNAPAGASIKYQAHVSNIGWQNWVSNGQTSGTTGQSRRVEAIKITLENMPGYSVQYQTHVQNKGWQNWVSDGQVAGTVGKSLRVEAIRIRIVKISDNTNKGIQYQGHAQNIGWQSPVTNGQLSGTEGLSLRLEALKINLLNAPSGASIKYQAYVSNIGWQNWLSNGQAAGTTGQSRRVEAIKITLENMPGYSVQYQTHVQNIGWQNWVSNGQVAGTVGKSLRIEAIKIRIVSIVNLTSVSLSKTTDTLIVGHTDNLTANVTPSNATNQAVTWASSNNAIATVDNAGKVTAVSAGKATITARTVDGNKTANCIVIVNHPGIKGIDVSKWQETINWALVKSDGIKFAMIRSSYGDGTSTYENNGVDPMFETNYAAAKANGIAVGAYHYSHATTVNQAAAEANFFINQLKGKQFEYPVSVDIEDPSQGGLGKETLTNIAITYLNTLKQAGYYPMIYTNKYWFTSVLDDTKLTSYDHWLAQWGPSITYSGTGKVGIWQYTSSGSVNGITGCVDMDTSFVDYASQIKSLHLNGF